MGDGQWVPEKMTEQIRIKDVHKKNVCIFLNSVDTDTVNKLNIIKQRYKDYDQLTYINEDDIQKRIHVTEQEIEVVKNRITKINDELKNILNSKFMTMITSKNTINDLNSKLENLTSELKLLENKVKSSKEQSNNIKNTIKFVKDLYEAYHRNVSNKLYISDFFFILS